MSGDEKGSVHIVEIMRKMSQLRTMLKNEGISEKAESQIMDFVANVINQAFEEGTKNKTSNTRLISP